ncbi:MAG TPA: pyridoxal phosphate-dependent aminotransferase [Vicinamibacterales bacterium]|nr:pyridoxal phosphate-dependent aminotransferase [Vicinamibacterales bacterium]
MSRVSASPTLKVLVEADKLRQQGVDVVEFGAGEPDFPTPDHVKAAGHAAIDANFTKYTPAAGTSELKQAIATRYKNMYGVDYKANEVIVTAGGKQALYNVALALFGAGDEVITHAPCWPTLIEQVRLADATPIIAQTSAENGFTLDAPTLLNAVTPQTRAIIVNSPCNPTGALMDEHQMAMLADEVAGKNTWIIVDLCYEQLIYEAIPHNLPKVLADKMKDRTILCGSASKSYSMTGWRCGWAVGPAEVISACNAIQSHSTSNVSSISQKAAFAAVTGPQGFVKEMLEEYRKRRDALHGWLTADPRIKCVKPNGAFYLFIDISALLSPDGIRTSGEFAERLLQEAHVALTAGEGFEAPGFLRISYATSMDRLKEGTRRIQAFIEKLEHEGKVPAVTRV